MNEDTLAERWTAEHAVTNPNTSADDGTDEYWTSPGQAQHNEDWALLAALAFLRRHGTTLLPAMAVLRLIWLEGWAIGHTAAAALLRDEDAAWAWAEGDTEAAVRTLPQDVAQAAEAWAQASTAWAQQIASGREQALAQLLAAAAGQRLTAARLATRIRQLLGDRTWARMTALTELVRASTAAAVDQYTRTGVRMVAWVAEPDERTCPRCLANDAHGPVPLGSVWPDGSTAPPAHPSCRCYLAPA
ncbi:phage minor head protein [Kitasatospora sp. NPDC001175]|uniref:phage minor head protein n=1 Tax=Kitasatospora sp. NPDC001175 TaxID=3157103 RepID=UPI003D06001E